MAFTPMGCGSSRKGFAATCGYSGVGVLKIRYRADTLPNPRSSPPTCYYNTFTAAAQVTPQEGTGKEIKTESSSQDAKGAKRSFVAFCTTTQRLSWFRKTKPTPYISVTLDFSGAAAPRRSQTLPRQSARLTNTPCSHKALQDSFFYALTFGNFLGVCAEKCLARHARDISKNLPRSIFPTCFSDIFLSPFIICVYTVNYDIS